MPQPDAKHCGIGWRHRHYAQVLEERPDLGFLEVHSENFFGEGGAALATLAQAREHYAISLHGVGLSLGSACGLDARHVQQLKALVQRIEPALVSDHACFARASSSGQHAHAADLLPIPFNASALAVLCANVQRVQDALQRPIAVEHLSAYVAWDGASQSETEFLNALTQRTGCKLVLDVNNAYVNALNAERRGECSDPLAEASRFVAEIRAGSVAEIHLAGHLALADIVIDDHGSRVAEPVWALYAQAAARFADAASLVEWDTDVPELAVLLQEAERADAVRADALAEHA